MFVPRIPLAVGTAVAVIAGVGWFVDSVAATKVERGISRQVEQQSRLDVSPSVSAGGGPYLPAVLTGEIPRLSVEALDVTVEGLGMVNARTELAGLDVSPGQVLGGNIDGVPAELISRTISLDGVALGHLLGMTDLDIANPYNISPTGGVSSEAQMTGTPEGFDEPVTVVVDLRLVGPEFRMTPRELVDVPEERADAAREAFTYSLDTRRLPLSGQAASVTLAGGSIYFETQRHNITVRLSDLSPIDESTPTDDREDGESDDPAAAPAGQ